MQIFRTLMRTRRSPAQFPEETEAALNLVEIEFARRHQVLEAWRKLYDHLSKEHPRSSDEMPSAWASGEDIMRCEHN